MHIHANQINLNPQLDASYTAEKVAAKREAERFRKKLLESASKLASGSDSGEGYIAGIGTHEQSQEQTEQQDQQDRSRPKEERERADSDDADDAVSVWA
jgi:hypothetical protein